LTPSCIVLYGGNVKYIAAMASEIRYVDPRELRVPASRPNGADPIKLARQISLFGSSAAGMPPLYAYEGLDGYLLVYNGITRATRIAKLSPNTLVPVEVGGRLARRFKTDPSIADFLP
jgi:hypothetical protein